MLNFVDRWLDRITMYRLLLYYLIALVAAAAVLSQLNYLHYKPLAIVGSAVYLVAVCYLTNQIFAGVWKAAVNRDSSLITALILALIVSPASGPRGVVFLTAAGGLAIASKYILAIRGRLIFNPAAISVVLLSLGTHQSATWWVGSRQLLPVVIIGGLLLARKIRHEYMISIFLLVAVAATVIYSLLGHSSVSTALRHTMLDTAIFYLAFVMLTEPATSPSVKGKQIWYAAAVGLLFPPQVHLGHFYGTPEIALVIGNIFAFALSPQPRLWPKLKNKVRLSPTTADFIFTPGRKISYEAGQYMEWALPHEHADSRGERRYFTLASSPTESDLHLGVKFYPKGSTYKHALMSINEHTRITASRVSGDFILPKNSDQKLAFIAGGIGITPFRSMLKYLTDTGDGRLVTLLYSASQPEEFVYKDVLEAARHKVGARTIYISPQAPTGENYRAGSIDEEMISREIPDFAERLFYIAGPQPMVHAVTQVLRTIGVPRSRIKTDFFPGYS